MLSLKPKDRVVQYCQLLFIKISNATISKVNTSSIIERVSFLYRKYRANTSYKYALTLIGKTVIAQAF